MHKTKKNRGGGGGQVEGRGSGGVNVNQELKLSCKCIRKSGVRLGDYSFNPSFTHSVYYINPKSRSEDAINTQRINHCHIFLCKILSCKI